MYTFKSACVLCITSSEKMMLYACLSVYKFTSCVYINQGSESACLLIKQIVETVHKDARLNTLHLGLLYNISLYRIL